MGRAFLDLLERHGYNFFTGVPCSLLEGVTRILDADPRYGYVSAVREDAALGLAAGAYLGGRQPVVLMQNSGLGVSVNALVSLHQIYDMPALLVVSWRGQDAGDAPEHSIMGRVTAPLLQLLAIPFEVFDRALIDAQLESLTTTMRTTKRPVALVVPKGILER
ncbi:MAG TPA: thiamine pyrophosphate-binding protein [Vicinamibacterales bacterium]|nr:thiamine pyrophosphate-binding protein [Vicinamibacterales bacterium]